MEKRIGAERVEWVVPSRQAWLGVQIFTGKGREKKKKKWIYPPASRKTQRTHARTR
jgi:hypothetical protein